MAERRTYTDEDKAKILAHNAEHGPKVTAEHFKVATSMINRWRHQAEKTAPKPTKPVLRQKGQWRTKKWTDDKIAGVLEYLKTHTHEETKNHFKVSASQISVWRRGLPYAYYKSKRKANGAHPATNGLGELPERDALTWLERWRQAYFDRIKAETPSAQSVLKALRGGK